MSSRARLQTNQPSEFLLAFLAWLATMWSVIHDSRAIKQRGDTERMARVLVTGASGFIGRCLGELLVSQGHHTSCLVRPTSDTDVLRKLDCELIIGDVTDADSLPSALKRSKPDYVYHLAGITKARRQADLFAVNEGGVKNLMRAVGELESPPVVLVVSTLAAARPACDGSPVLESDPSQPTSLYGQSKLAGEQAAISFSDHVPLTIVRPPIVFGPHDRDAFEMFKVIATLGLHFVPAWKPMSVSWIHVSDACRAFMLAATLGRRATKSHPTAGTYFATSHEIVDYRQLGQRIAAALGNRWFVPVPTPSLALFGAAGINELLSRINGKPHILNLDKAREATAGSWTCSGEKLNRDAGFECQMTLEQTLQTSVGWYRQAGWLR